MIGVKPISSADYSDRDETDGQGASPYVTVVGDPARLERYLRQWEDLARHASAPNAFYEPWVLLPMLRHLDRHISSEFVLIHATKPGGAGARASLIGFFPLQRKALHALLPLHRFRLWRSALTLRCTPLVRAGFEDVAVSAFFDWFRTGHDGRALLEMQRVPADNPVHDALARHRTADPRLRWDESCRESHLFDRATDAETYMSGTLSRKMRTALRRNHRLLAQKGPVQFIEAVGSCDMDAVADTFLRIEASGWKGENGTALIADPGQSACFREILHAGARNGRLSVRCLSVDGTVVAAQATFLTPPGSFAFKIAYDETHPAAKQSPGTVLGVHCVERMHEDSEPLGADIRWCDSCAGPESALDRRLRTRPLPIYTYRIAPRHGLGALPVMLLPLLRRLRNARSHRQNRSEDQ